MRFVRLLLLTRTTPIGGCVTIRITSIGARK
jgi:hypothetical protein